MSFWRRLLGKDDDQAEPDPSVRPKPATAPAARGDADLADGDEADGDEADGDADDRERKRILRLRRVGREDGSDVDEALALLRQSEGSAVQPRYLDAIIAGLSDDTSLDPLRVACAALLDERGQRDDALRLVSVSRSIDGMMLGAELYAAAGRLPPAVSMVERVLAPDNDTPGARERHERWSAQLGRRPRELHVDDGATVVAPTTQQTRFRLIREVARGGAGTVYEAEDETLGRRLAYKVYHQAERDHAQIEREARAAIRLTGPGVVRVYDADPEGGWLASEWIAHGSLRDLIENDRVDELLPLDDWLPALLRALERVHAEGLVHNDIKPANLLFRDLTDPLLSDFGVCQPSGESALTGTPGYISPERIDGASAEPRDDIYAVGRIIDDVLGARDDAELDDRQRQQSETDARRWAKLALACMADADQRPADATALMALAALDADEAQNSA